MAHEELPKEFDAIILGTGLTECILAAALARIGQRVLHIDRNEYYSGDWATFSWKQLQSWISDQEVLETRIPEDKSCIVAEGETEIPLQVKGKTHFNIRQSWYIRKAAEDVKDNNIDEETNLKQTVKETNFLAKNESDLSESKTDNTQERADIEIVCSVETDQQSTKDSILSEGQSSASPELKCHKDTKKEKKVWTQDAVEQEWRKFNLDLAPKVLFSRGSLVELLISSDIAKYAEFKQVTRILTHLNGNIVPVPCSRADVFGSKAVTIIEKRMLMKFLTFCVEYESHPKEYEGYEDKLFTDFLKSKKLSPNVHHYVKNAIAMATDKMSTLEGLERTKRFLRSLGRYGNTPFLWTLYGSGELPQCFCRMCAVFGGIYYLKLAAQSLIVDADNICKGMICTQGNRFHTRWMIMDSSYASSGILPEQYGDRSVSRAMLLTDRSLLPADHQVTLLSIPSGDDLYRVTVYEVGWSAQACPQDLYVVHLTCPGVDTAENDLKHTVDMLFSEAFETSGDSESDSRPRILWSLYFNQTDSTYDDINSRAPENVYITSGPGSTIDFEHAVQQAEKMFKQMCPDEEFLPKAPNPEDIIFDNPQGQDNDSGIIDNTEDPDANSTVNGEQETEWGEDRDQVDSGEVQTDDVLGEVPGRSNNEINDIHVVSQAEPEIAIENDENACVPGNQ